jgi:hypothetical protein
MIFKSAQKDKADIAELANEREAQERTFSSMMPGSPK